MSKLEMPTKNKMKKSFQAVRRAVYAKLAVALLKRKQRKLGEYFYNKFVYHLKREVPQ